jgi:integrase
MHFILSGACKRAVRWKWVTDSPLCARLSLPLHPCRTRTRRAHPSQPGSSIEAWKDPDWGTLIWLAMTTGARWGELCPLLWSRIDLTSGRAVMSLRRAINKGGARSTKA